MILDHILYRTSMDITDSIQWEIVHATRSVHRREQNLDPDAIQHCNNTELFISSY